MRPILPAAAIAWLALVAPAAAFTIVPAGDESGRIFVVIERDYGDLVPLAALPPPFDTIIQTRQGADTLSFRWRYFRSDEDGLCYIRVDDDGAGVVSIAFHDPEPAAGDRLGAAAVLLGRDGRALHSLLARVDVEAGADRTTYRIEMVVSRPPEWWRKVGSIGFLTMKYYRQQAPDDQGVWEAMQRAVDRFTGGVGTSQRATAK